MTELVAGIGHRDRVGAIGKPFSREDFGSLGAAKMIRIKAQLNRERPVQFDQSRLCYRRRRDPGEKARWECRIAILEGEMDRHGLKMGIPGKLAIVNSRPANMAVSLIFEGISLVAAPVWLG
jgi:hypothetical protein